MNPKELLAKSPFTGRVAKLPDGYVFYQKKDDSWVDNIDPDLVDMSWPSTEEFRASLIDDIADSEEEAEAILSGTWEPDEESARTMQRWFQGESLANAVLEGKSVKDFVKNLDPDPKYRAYQQWKDDGEAKVYSAYLHRGGITAFKVSGEDAIKLHKEHGDIFDLVWVYGETPSLLCADQYYLEMQDTFKELGVPFELLDEDTEMRWDAFEEVVQ